jgi:hypothetical protein
VRAWVQWMLRIHTDRVERREFLSQLGVPAGHIDAALGQSPAPELPGSSPTVEDRGGAPQALPTQRMHAHGGLRQPQQEAAERAGKRRKHRTRRTRRKHRNPDSMEQAAAPARDGHGSSDGGFARADGSHYDRGAGVQDRAENHAAAGCNAQAQANTMDPGALERSSHSLAENCADVLFPAEEFVESDEEDGGVMEQFKCYMNKDLETIRRDVMEQADAEALQRVRN